MSQILIISCVFPPEPVVSSILSRDIAEALSANHAVTVLCPQPSRPEGFVFEKRFNPGNYTVKRLNSFTCATSNLIGRLRESFSFGKYCSKYIQENAKGINCIYVNSWPIFSQYKIIKSAKKFNIPTALHIQDIYPESLSNKLPALIRKLFTILLLPVDRFILKNATLIFGISPNMISYLSATRKIDKKKFELIRNWQNDDQFINHIPKEVSGKKTFVFVYAGSISASAGVYAIIYGFHKAGLPDAKLIIAGNGSDKANCMAIARQLGNGQVEFCEVQPEKIPALQSQADILLLPLKKGIAKTATPSKLTAYLLSAKPVIACVENESDVANILKEGKCGFIVEPENIDEIAQVMLKVCNMKKTNLEEIGQNGKNYAILNLAKKANLGKLTFLIENITEWK